MPPKAAAQPLAPVPQSSADLLKRGKHLNPEAGWLTKYYIQTYNFALSLLYKNLNLRRPEERPGGDDQNITKKKNTLRQPEGDEENQVCLCTMSSLKGAAGSGLKDTTAFNHETIGAELLKALEMAEKPIQERQRRLHER